MSYKAALIDNIYYVRWQEPERPDPNRIFREVSQASKSLGRPIIYIAVSPENSPAPDKETRQEMVRIFEHLSQHCTSVHLIYEARGFKASIKRNVMTGILLASKKFEKVKVHKSEEDALAGLAERVDLDRFRQRATELGLNR